MKYLLITIAAMILVGCFDTETPSTKSTATSIHKAVIEEDIEAVNNSLEAGIDINTKDEKGWAPMHLVAISGNKVIAELLLRKGANVNERTDSGWTPLHLADDKKIAQPFSSFVLISIPASKLLLTASMSPSITAL